MYKLIAKAIHWAKLSKEAAEKDFSTMPKQNFFFPFPVNCTDSKNRIANCNSHLPFYLLEDRKISLFSDPDFPPKSYCSFFPNFIFVTAQVTVCSYSG